MLPRRQNIMNRRHLLLSAVALAALSACSGPYTIRSEVSSFGNWPSGRAPGSYAFDRLPSQLENTRQGELEEAARAALEKAGFKPAADPKSADVLVALGVRVSAQDRAPWDDPLWWRWHGNINLWRYGRHGYASFYPGYPGYPLDRRYDREVALLLRDRGSSEPLYEARASNDGLTQGDAELIGAMFEAALSDFPTVRPEPHDVAVQRVR
jgi:Domain of unknown function (DUF4136)